MVSRPTWWMGPCRRSLAMAARIEEFRRRRDRRSGRPGCGTAGWMDGDDSGTWSVSQLPPAHPSGGEPDGVADRCGALHGHRKHLASDSNKHPNIVQLGFRWPGHETDDRSPGPRAHYLDASGNDFPGTRRGLTIAKRSTMRRFYAQTPGRNASEPSPSSCVSQDAADNGKFRCAGQAFRLSVLAFGGEATFGPMIGQVIKVSPIKRQKNGRFITRIAGHWITEKEAAAGDGQTWSSTSCGPGRGLKEEGRGFNVVGAANLSIGAGPPIFT